MKQYLVIECKELCDQYECDCDRTPILVTSDRNIVHSYGLGYEIWEINNDGTLDCIKEYDEPDEEGMALYYWDGDVEENKPIVVKKWKNKTRNDPVPKKVWDFFEEKEGMFVFDDESKETFCNEVKRCGASSFYFFDENNTEHYTVYGHYMDDNFSTDY